LIIKRSVGIMKGIRAYKRVVAIVVAVLVLGTAGAAFAATAKTPAEIVSGLTGKTLDQLYTERADGKTYGTIAGEAGKLDEFKTQMLEQKKAILDQRVKDGKLTQEQADQIYNTMKANQALCDGPGGGMGAGRGAGMGASLGAGNGAGRAGGCGFGGGMNRGLNR
jgi:hypothetical protein